ncbi:MAG: hypothetical protein JWM80_4085 [Cyanobacteria bacterium RYN_339]|nr:hypothetical protein [Cyanobacteria bacterium RYN_339]
MKRILALAIAATLAPLPALAAPSVKLGVEVLLSKRLDLVKGKRIGLITNVSATDGQGRSDIDLLARAPGVKLTALFAPEHGVRATLDVEDIPDGRDPATGVPIFSLYNKDRAPTAKQTANVDVLVFDIQDSGSRFYTYTTTLGLCMEAAKKLHKPFIVLDRPNPITGVAQGEMLDPAFKHFTGRYPLTIRHGMTIGELARYINGEEHVGADLTVVPMEGWHRSMWYDQTGLPWHRPSPAMTSPDTALYYVGIGLFEATNVDCRSGGHPFRWVGASWADGKALAIDMNARRLPGVRFNARRVGSEDGVDVVITDRSTFKPIEAAVEMMASFRKLHPAKFEAYRSGLGHMSGSDAMWTALTTNGDLRALATKYGQATLSYDAKRRPYLLYRD